MKITNRKAATKRKRIFFLISVFIALTALALFLLDHTSYALIMVGVFSIWYLYFHVADYQYIEFLDENEKIILRYYKAVGFGKREFNAIEFPQNLLRNFHFENSIFGKLSAITFIITTKKGVAEYPQVSLTAVPFEDRLRIRESLNKILEL